MESSSISAFTYAFPTTASFKVYSAGNLATVGVLIQNWHDVQSAYNNQLVPFVNSALVELKGGSSDVVYYVNVNSGGTAGNLGLSPITALSSINSAVANLQPLLNYTAVIQIATGTYAETVLVEGFYGKGKIVLQGHSALTAAKDVQISHLRWYSNQIKLSALGIMVYGNTYTVGIDIRNCAYADIKYYYIGDKAGSRWSWGVRALNSNLGISYGKINSATKAINAEDGSIVRSYSNSGVNVDFAYGADGSIIFTTLVTPTYDLASSLNSFGGQVFSE